jgi:hypothetical protein
VGVLLYRRGGHALAEKEESLIGIDRFLDNFFELVDVIVLYSSVCVCRRATAGRSRAPIPAAPPRPGLPVPDLSTRERMVLGLALASRADPLGMRREPSLGDWRTTTPSWCVARRQFPEHR